MSKPFRVLVAPDKFKGSLAAAEVAETISAALRRYTPTLEVRQCPVADGGEGTVDLALSVGFAPVTVTATGPLGAPVEATFALRGTMAVLEMASAAGLTLLPSGPDAVTAMDATTYGVGELILAALDRGATKIVLGAGGSATTDGGVGALEALGVDVAALGQVPRRPDIARHGLDPRLAHVDLMVACDVDNPLLGPDGAVQVYGPQKGADTSCLVELELRLARWADVVAQLTGRDLREHAGVGAAGGLAFGLVALGGARILSGAELLMELTGLEAVAAAADLVIVGEGSLDRQSLRGKGPIGVARVAASQGTDVVALAGRSLLTESEWRQAGLRAVYALTEVESDPQVCMQDARRLLGEVAAIVAADWLPRHGGRGDAGVRPLAGAGASAPNPVPLSPSEFREALLSSVVEAEQPRSR